MTLRTLRTQRGEGLIPMMIGMLLTLFAVLAMLMAYRTMVAVAVPASRAALRDGQSASALIAAQIELQQAGFGVDTAVDGGVNIIVTGAGREIIWRFRRQLDDPSPSCAGLRLVTSSATGSGGIYFLPPLDCLSAATPPAWPVGTPRLIASETVLYEPAEDDEREGEVRSYNLSDAVFELIPGQDCGPFGIPGAEPTRTRVMLRDTVRNVQVFTYCLTNT